VTPIGDVLDWAEMMPRRRSLEDPWRVASTEIPNGLTVSTVFLGLDHQRGDGPPLLFETMVFPDCEDAWRYSTWDQAGAGHDQVVEIASHWPGTEESRDDRGIRSPTAPTTPSQEQVDKWGRLFARIMDKRDGIGTQEAVDEAVDEVLGTAEAARRRTLKADEYGGEP
jgi:hypothetical protein